VQYFLRNGKKKAKRKRIQGKKKTVKEEKG